MKLTGNLKKQVEKAETREAARETIAQAGMLLNDDELDQVAGGGGGGRVDYCSCEKPDPCYEGIRHATCQKCGKPIWIPDAFRLGIG